MDEELVKSDDTEEESTGWEKENEMSDENKDDEEVLGDDKDKNYWLNVDQSDTIAWDFKVPWSFFESLRDTRSVHVDTTSERQSFKGGEYSLLVRFSRNNGLCVYTGLNDLSKLSSDYFLSVKYKITMRMYLNGEPVWKELAGDVKDYRREFSDSGNLMELVDHGRTNLIGCSDMLLKKDKYCDDDGFVLFRCEYQALPVPPIVTPDHDSKLKTGMVGLENLGATCYLNSLLQMLYHINAFRSCVFNAPLEGEDIDSSIILAMQSIFNKLQTGSRTVSTTELTRAFGWDSLEAFQQQDVQEMLRLLLDRLEERMRDKEPVDGVIKKLFAGKIKSYIRCVNIDYESAREEDFYDIQLDVKGCQNVYDSFKKYSEKEMLNGENQYDAGEDADGKPRGKQDAEKGVVFTELPPVLTIHLKRFEFDMQLMGFAKIHDKYEFPMRLELDQFVECPQSQSQLNRPANNFILHSVLIHAGDVYGGHYYAYIRPSMGEFWKNISEVDQDVSAAMSSHTPHCSDTLMDVSKFGGKWFKFDDDYVTRVDRRQAVEGSYGSAGETYLKRNYHSAYMLVYIREKEASEIMSEVNIPPSLITRLNEEYRLSMEIQQKRESQQNFKIVFYLLREDLDNFSDYRPTYDFFEEDKLRQLSIMKRTTLLGYLTAFANELDVRIDQIRLWTVTQADARDVWRIDERLELDQACMQPLSFGNIKCYLYVEVVPHFEDECLVENMKIFSEDEENWLQKCRFEINEYDGERGYDRMAGCGAGRGNLPLHLSLPDTDTKAELVEEGERLMDLLRNILLESISYDRKESDTFMIIGKALNIDITGKIKTPEVMKTLFVHSVNGDIITYGGLFRHGMSTIKDSLRKRLSNGVITENEANSHFALWDHALVVKAPGPTDLDQIPRIMFRYPIVNSSEHHNLQCGDIVCLVPDALLPSDSDKSNEEKVNYFEALTLYLRSVVLEMDMIIKPHQRIHVPHGAILNRRTGLWVKARELIEDRIGNGVDKDVDIIPEGGKLISLNEDYNREKLLAEIDANLHFGEKARLRIGIHGVGGNGKKIFEVAQENILKRTHEFEELLLEVLPFPVLYPQIDKEIMTPIKYYEVYLAGAALKSIRRKWLAEVIHPRAIELYSQQLDRLEMDKSTSAFHLKRVYESLPWGEGVTPVPDEFICIGKCYMRVDLSEYGSTTAATIQLVKALTVHDVVQQLRGHLRVPVCSMKQDGEDLRKKRSAEAAGLDEGLRDEQHVGDEVSTSGDSSPVSMPSSRDGDKVVKVTTHTACLSNYLSFAEQVLESNKDKCNIMMFTTRGGKINRIFKATDFSMDNIPQCWVEDGIYNSFSRHVTTSPLCAQLVSHEDYIFMTSRHPDVRSIPISVFSFEFALNSARTRPRISETEAGPFFCYVREDDTHETLVRRLEETAGSDTDTEWSSVRMAIVSGRDSVPHFIPRDAATPHRVPALDTRAVTPPITGALNRNSPLPSAQEMPGSDHLNPESVWQLFRKYYPAFTEGTVRNMDQMRSLTLPQLGLQRPTADSKVAPPTSQRVHRVGSGIKIN